MPLVPRPRRRRSLAAISSVAGALLVGVPRWAAAQVAPQVAPTAAAPVSLGGAPDVDVRVHYRGTTPGEQLVDTATLRAHVEQRLRLADVPVVRESAASGTAVRLVIAIQTATVESGTDRFGTVTARVLQLTRLARDPRVAVLAGTWSASSGMLSGVSASQLDMVVRAIVVGQVTEFVRDYRLANGRSRPGAGTG